MSEEDRPRSERDAALERTSTTLALARRGAENLVVSHLRVARGEKVVLFHVEAGEVLPVILGALSAAGASVTEIDLGAAAQDERAVQQLVRERAEGAAASLYVSAGAGVNYRFARLLVDTLDTTGVRHLHAPGISLRMLSTSLRADPTLLGRVNERLHERLGSGKTLTVRSAAGTNLTVALGRGFPFVTYDGVPKVGAWNSVPTGSVNWYSPNVGGVYVADRIARGTHLGHTSDAGKTPVRLRIEESTLVEHTATDTRLARELGEHFGKHPNATTLGFVALSTNYVARAELRVFAHDVILPGLRLQFGYSDQKKTQAPRTAPIWATFLGRKQTVAIDGEVLVEDGRFDSRWVEGIVPF